MPTTTVFDDIKFDPQLDNEIGVQVQAKIKHAMILVSGKVKAMNLSTEWVPLQSIH